MKWLFGIIVIAAAVAGLWWMGWLGNLQGFFAMPPTAPLPQATTTPQEAPPLNGMSANNNASDAALLQDSAAIDAQLQAYSSDSAAVDQSLQDKQGAQSY